jgi:hypothetical protein
MLSEWDDTKLSDSDTIPLFKDFIARECEFLEKNLSRDRELNKEDNFRTKDGVFEERLKIMQKISPNDKEESFKVFSMITNSYSQYSECIGILKCMHKIIKNNKDFVLDESICDILKTKLIARDTNIIEKADVLEISLIQISRKMSIELEDAIIKALNIGNLSFEANIWDSIDEISMEKLKFRVYELLLIHHNWKDTVFLSNWLSKFSILFEALEPEVEDSLASKLIEIYSSYSDENSGGLAKAILEKLKDKKLLSKQNSEAYDEIKQEESLFNEAGICQETSNSKETKISPDKIRLSFISNCLKDKGKEVYGFSSVKIDKLLKKFIKKRFLSMNVKDKADFLNDLKESEKKASEELLLCKKILFREKYGSKLANAGIEIALGILDSKTKDNPKEYEEADYVLAEQILFITWKLSMHIEKSQFDRIRELASKFLDRRTLLLALNNTVTKTEKFDSSLLVPIFWNINFSSLEEIKNEDIIAEIMMNALEVWTDKNKKSKGLNKLKCDLILQMKAIECLLKEESDSELISKRIDNLTELFNKKQPESYVPPLLVKLLLEIVEQFTLTQLSSKWMVLLIKACKNNAELYKVFEEEGNHFITGLDYFARLTDKEHLKPHALELIKNALRNGVVVKNEIMIEILKIPDYEFIKKIWEEYEQPNHHFYYQTRQFWIDVGIDSFEESLNYFFKEHSEGLFIIKVFKSVTTLGKNFLGIGSSSTSPTQDLEKEQSSENLDLIELWKNQKDEYFKHISPIWISFLKKCLKDKANKKKIFEYMHTCPHLFSNFEFKIQCEGYFEILKMYFGNIELKNAFENIKSFIFLRIKHEQTIELLLSLIKNMLNPKNQNDLLKALELLQIDLIGERLFEEAMDKLK